METPQSISLKLKNREFRLLERFNNLFLEEEFTDVTIYCEDNYIKAHKVVLASFSSYFHNVFKRDKSPHPIIIFQNVPYNALVSVIQFLYNGEIVIAEELLQPFLQTAELLKVQNLTNTNEAQEFLQKHDETSHSASAEKSAPTEHRTHDLFSTLATESNSSIHDNANYVISPIECSSENPNQFRRIYGDSRSKNPNEMTEQAGYSYDQFDQPRELRSLRPSGSGSILDNSVIFTCHICFKAFRTRRTFMKHKDVHKGLTLCKICNKVFSQAAILKRHIKRQHRSEPNVSTCNTEIEVKEEVVEYS